ncbi:GGDEF domain-containing protein [Actinoplanes teichomyceticus]|uniref:Diguanylate cyclase (GGDEF)-like protein n=1 Tax=Actinoplanes teichomyceticus TaxID=1867 RepID=A0A561VGF5_ACTTI|nr:GGDEF domain-containing protein [Actinoplanes teichomyceticus]TWG10678.1 diguanylate cyclase (GGDEF)-like protein [Actinoplanes teichomyceticus]GIF15447.1 hypothetical protein Ate01nite_54790 [Actinoplanes teichomyceticus]
MERIGAVRRVDGGLVLLGAVAVVVLACCAVGDAAWLGRVVWPVVTAGFAGFAVISWRVARTTSSRGVRRLWGTCVLAGAGFVLAGLIQFAAAIRDARAPGVVLGTGAYATALSAGTAAVLVGLLSGPPAVASGQARIRYRLDVTTVMVAASAVSLYAIDLTAGDQAGQSQVQWIAALVTGPAPLFLEVLAMIKLLMGGNPPFAPVTGWVCGVAAGCQGVLLGLPDGWALAHAGAVLSLEVVGALLLAAGARLQLLHAGAPDAPARERGLRYSLTPYLAIVATFALLVVELLRHGLTAHAWILLVGMFVCGVLVGLRQLAAFRQIADLSERLRELAYHDRLTGLANRALFMDRLTVAATPTVFLIDLDGFKPVNDRYGHAAGDELLTEVGRRLRGCARGTDVVARLGGDEFAVLVEDPDPRRRAELAAALAEALHAEVPIGDAVVPLRASIGAATAGPAWDPDLLLHEADMAMYARKAGTRPARDPAAPLPRSA